MNLVDILNKKRFGWDWQESCDIWLDDSGQFHDIGHDYCHQSYLGDILRLKDPKEVIEKQWIKITNQRSGISVEGDAGRILEFLPFWFNVVANRLSFKENFTLSIRTINKQTKTTNCVVVFNLPKDIIKLVELFQI